MVLAAELSGKRANRGHDPFLLPTGATVLSANHHPQGSFNSGLNRQPGASANRATPGRRAAVQLDLHVLLLIRKARTAHAGDDRAVDADFDRVRIQRAHRVRGFEEHGHGLVQPSRLLPTLAQPHGGSVFRVKGQ